MSIISLKSFEQLVQEMMFIIKASTDKITDFNIGSVTRSYLECIALMNQYLASKIEELEEAFYINTATGNNLDRRAADFGLTRKLGAKASGTLWFYSFSSPGTPITIPIGTIVNTQKDDDGNYLQFITTETIILDSTDTGTPTGYPYAAKNDGINNPTTNSECLIYGVIGNVSGNSIIELETDISGVVGVLNLESFSGGEDSESDEDFRQRIKLYIQSLAKGTKAALTAAILAVSTVDGVVLQDWNDVDPLGPSPIDPGNLRIILDTENNTALPSPINIGGDTLTTEVQLNVWNAIKDDVKAAGVGVIFEQTTLITVDVDIDINLDPDTDLNRNATISIETFNSIFKGKVEQFFSKLEVNENVQWSKIIQLATNIQGVEGVDDITLTANMVNYNKSNVPIGPNNEKALLGTITVNGNII